MDDLFPKIPVPKIPVFVFAVVSLFTCVFNSGGAALAFDEQKVTHGLVALEKKHLYLFDRANHYRHAVKVTGDALLPHRVYLKYDATLHLWIYFRTSFSGKIPDPLEVLRPGTVATGAVVGAELRRQRFLLTDDGTWTSSALPEEYHVYVMTKPPELRRYFFAKDPDAPTAAERQLSSGKTSPALPSKPAK